MKKKVLYINLPDGAFCRMVKVTEDGRNGIVYTEKNVSNDESIKVPLMVPISKPEPLVGGTEVYCKNNSTPYWYCKIKAGRDEFMYLYFNDLTRYDLLFDSNGKEREFVTERQKKFKANALKALNNKPTEGYCWIPVFEPSEDSEGNLQYVAGVETLVELDVYDWQKLFYEYSPVNGSRQASITTYFLLALRWLKDGIATLEQLADDSKDIGHYSDSENAKHDLEETGEREFGGLYGFAGNTYKIVKDSASCSGFSIVGGVFNADGGQSPLADVAYDYHPNCLKLGYVGLLELTK